MYDSALAIMRIFQDLHPGDRRAAAMIARLGAILHAPAATPAESVLQTDPMVLPDQG